MSPYHVQYLNPQYGISGEGAGKRKVELMQPRFHPLSTGVPAEPLPGVWHCLKCGTASDSSVPVHYCANCRITPIRQASLRAPNLSTSKYCVPSSGNDEDGSASGDDLDDDFDYDARDHQIIARNRHISEYGKKWSQADIHSQNNEVCRYWMSLDDTLHSPIFGGRL